MMRTAFVAVILVLLVAVVSRFCVRKVPLGYVGVRINQLTNTIELRDLQPGYQFVLPGMHKLDLIPSTVQVTNLGGSGDTATHPSFNVRARDEYTVTLDITFLWRVQTGHAADFRQSFQRLEMAEPVFTVEGLNILQEVLGTMTTEDFYNAATRREKAHEARVRFDEFTRRSFITVEEVLLRNVVYDDRYEQKIRERQALEQQQQVERSLTIVENEQKLTETINKESGALEMAIAAEKDKVIRTLVAETTARVAVIEASAELYAQSTIAAATRTYRERVAQGDLLRTRARAEGLRAISQAYAGTGGERYLLRQMIDNIGFGEIEVNTNQVNPFDVRQLLQMLGAGGDFALPERPSPPPLAPETILP